MEMCFELHGDILFNYFWEGKLILSVSGRLEPKFLLRRWISKQHSLKSSFFLYTKVTMSNIPSNYGSNLSLRAYSGAWRQTRAVRPTKSTYCCSSPELLYLLYLPLFFSSPPLLSCAAPLLSYKRWKDLRWHLVCCRTPRSGLD